MNVTETNLREMLARRTAEVRALGAEPADRASDPLIERVLTVTVQAAELRRK